MLAVDPHVRAHGHTAVDKRVHVPPRPVCRRPRDVDEVVQRRVVVRAQEVRAEVVRRHRAGAGEGHGNGRTVGHDKLEQTARPPLLPGRDRVLAKPEAKGKVAIVHAAGAAAVTAAVEKRVAVGGGDGHVRPRHLVAAEREAELGVRRSAATAAAAAARCGI